MCRKKKAERPRMLLVEAPDEPNVDDSGTVHANVVLVDEGESANTQCHLLVAPDGKITERFYADPGANRSMHPNIRAAAIFYRLGLNIGIAAEGKNMQSDGVGKMLLYTPQGDLMPGFDRYFR